MQAVMTARADDSARPGVVKISFDASAADVEALDARAEARQVSRSDVLREAVRLWLGAQRPLAGDGEDGGREA